MLLRLDGKNPLVPKHTSEIEPIQPTVSFVKTKQKRRLISASLKVVQSVCRYEFRELLPSQLEMKIVLACMLTADQCGNFEKK